MCMYTATVFEKETPCVGIEITESLKAWVKEKAAEKKKEYREKKRGQHTNLNERNLVGILGEIAVEEWIVSHGGYRFIDWKIGRNSEEFDKPDVEYLGVGIKTAQPPLEHLIPYKNRYGQILCNVNIDDKKQRALVYIIGYATPEVLNENQDNGRVRYKRILQSKTAFVGYDKLIPIKEWWRLEK